MADGFAVTMEHVQHRPLVPLPGFGEVVAVVSVGGRRKNPQASPPTLVREREEARRWSFGDDGQIEALTGVLRGALELIEQRYARRARALVERKLRRLAGRRTRPLITGIAREHEAVD